MKPTTIAQVKNYCCASELPVVCLHRMCVAYLNNDWLTMADSGVRLIATLAIVLCAGVAPGSTNA